jgi:glycosyltransferase involved in cell wall biosynthesis
MSDAPPIIFPRSDGCKTPDWSVVIPTYNCAKWLEITLPSVLGQAPEADRMQIVVVDDCSTKDDPAEVVARLGQGRVAFHRRSSNGGVVANFNTCLQLSRGSLVHLLHGDDWVLPGFYARVAAAAASNPKTGLFATRSFSVDENNAIISLSRRYSELEQPTHDPGSLLYGNQLLTPGVVVRRECYERQGGFRPDLVHCADWEMWLRQIAHEGVMVINEPLACYRVFPGNDTGRLSRTGENLRDLLRLEAYLTELFPQFSIPTWRHLLSGQAVAQRFMFRSGGDEEAAAANHRFWGEITPHRVRWLLRLEQFFRGRAHRWWPD